MPDPPPTPAVPARPPAPRRPAGRLHRVLRTWCRLCVVALAAAQAGGALSAGHGVADLLASFQAQYLAAGLLLAAALLALRSRRWAAAAGLAALVSAARVLPWYLPPADTSAVSAAPALRLVLANVYQENSQADAIWPVLERHAPDLVILQEIDARWWQRAQPLANGRPHTLFVPGDFVRGTALFARVPIAAVRTESFGNLLAPSVICSIVAAPRPFTLVVTHPWPPTDGDWFHSRNAQLAAVAACVRDLPGPRVLAGDLNATMWSAGYAPLERVAGLRNVRRGFGLVPTFPMDRLPLLRVPIDHVLVSPDVHVGACRAIPIPGSDHAALLVTLHLP